LSELTRPRPDARQIALLHDAPEYVIGDMISPFKAVMSAAATRTVEARLRPPSISASDCPPSLPRLKALIKRADMIAAYFEAVELAGFQPTRRHGSLLRQPPRGTPSR
jgi:5'-deoxynucleotidase YfbR-like HD superfamily hydrolase